MVMAVDGGGDGGGNTEVVEREVGGGGEGDKEQRWRKETHYVLPQN